MPSNDTKILEFNQYQKFDKAPFIIYTDLQCIIEKVDGCKNDSENSSTTKVSKYIFLMKDILLKLMLNILINYINFIMIYNFYKTEWKLKKSKSLQLI